jgi:peptidoglycan-N-acetylglucosamine deacetylase
MIFSRPPYLLRLFYRQFIWRFSNSEKAIYLTFDDGPHPEITPWVLQQLKQYNAKATFFMVGKNAADHPEIVSEIIANGHSIGNHTFNHLNGWETSRKDYISDVDKCHEIFDSKLFRPPYGKIKPEQAKHLVGRFKIIMWDVLSRDYDQKISPNMCFKIIKYFSRNGSIIVFHDSKKAERNLYYSLPRTLEHFSGKGFEFKAI